MPRGLPSLPLAVLSILALLVAGCIGGDDTSPPPVPEGERVVRATVQDENGTPVDMARVTVLDGPRVVALASTGPDGTADIALRGPADRAVAAHGRSLQEQALSGTSVIFQFASGAPEELLVPPDIDPRHGLQTSSITDLGSWQYAYSANVVSCRPVPPQPDATHDCGLSEPSIEVDGAGTIYYSAVCCVGGSPPIWVSRDDGANWEVLASDMDQREVFGIEGDFAVDDAGTMYFFDIELAAVQVSAWTKDGDHLHTTHLPAPPLVDRPWVRAEGDGTVYIVYNQGIGQSTFLRSTDQGRTFLPTEMTTLDYGFANIARGVAPGELWATGRTADGVAVDHSTDGGATWTRDAVLDAGPGWGFTVPVVALDGTPYVVYDGLTEDADKSYRVWIAHRAANGTWSGPRVISPDQGVHIMPWAAAGEAGKVVVAWYGMLGEDDEPGNVKPDDPWHLMMAASVDADAPMSNWQVNVADPEPVLVGPFVRQLLDFIQVDIGPDGAAHVAYAHLPEGANVETPVYLQTLANLGLADGRLLNGPHDA